MRLTTSEAVVLSELPVRYLALSRKLEDSPLLPLTCDYQATLTAAQADLLHGFEGRVPGLAGSV